MSKSKVRDLESAIEHAEEELASLQGLLAQVELERDIFKRAFRWFRCYPEFKPNPERMDEWAADVEVARSLYDETEGKR